MKVFALVLLFTAPLLAQINPIRYARPCLLTVAEFPGVRGIKLGMEETAYKKMFRNGDPSFMSKAEIQAALFSNELESIYTDFISKPGRLAYFRLYYDRTLLWNTGMEFAEAISEPLNLPVASWVKKGQDMAEMTCKEFRVEVNIMANSIAFTDTRQYDLPDKNNHARKAAFKP